MSYRVIGRLNGSARLLLWALQQCNTLVNLRSFDVSGDVVPATAVKLRW
jgi:hypothetical protein